MTDGELIAAWEALPSNEVLDDWGQAIADEMADRGLDFLGFPFVLLFYIGRMAMTSPTCSRRTRSASTSILQSSRSRAAFCGAGRHCMN